MNEKLLLYLENNSIDGFYISKPENVRCLSGFTGEVLAMVLVFCT